MNEYLLLCLIILMAGFIQGLTGFGSILVSLPLLALFIDIKVIIPLVSLFALVINVILTAQLRAHMSRKRLAPLLLATVPGILLGIYILKTVDSRTLELCLGGTIIAFSLYTLTSAPPRKGPAGVWAWLAGLLSGCLGASIAANGPPIIIYTALQPWSKNEIKSTLCGYFLIAGLGISLTHALAGFITHRVLVLFAAGLPALVAGIVLGSFLYGRISETGYRKAVAALILVLGLAMLRQGLAG
ncbi:MAG: sulfite exporter TauE/SafE family protein [Desulfovibrionaceae bacterium]|nr:sulfite exporter TauE/SafE family protein [Desulfovibrionaceae bacterium]MDD4951327.1 sulfite exporter TauE/SafE family protein [Desulfovibrionaceae bacterium]